MPLAYDTPLSALPGVGPVKEKALAKLGLTCLGDFLTFYPRRYEDRTVLYPIASAPIGVNVCVKAYLTKPATLSRVPGGRQLVRCTVADDTAAIDLTFFNRPYVRDSLHFGESYIFFGKLDLMGGRRTMVNPQIEPAGAPKLFGSLVPCYPLSAGLTNHQVAAWAMAAVDALVSPDMEFLPAGVLSAHDLMPADWCCRQIHRPDGWENLRLARDRLAFEELFLLTLGLSLLRRDRERFAALPLAHGEGADFAALLPFSLTGAQKKVIAQCAADLAKPVPMNRLVQGDVGSGKTAVAAFCLWRCAQSGAQGAMMAPTELLAQQHYRTLSAMLAPAGIRVALLTGSQTAAEKRAIRQQLADGDIQVLVGTHALLSQGVDFQNLALAVVDEQHRFGVNQRSALAAKGGHPHVLVLSATPIPRTLALIVYGDLDVSVLDELPPGRKPVDTFLVSESKRQRLYGFIDKQVAEGRQVYIVCPAVEESEAQEGDPTLKSVKAYAAHLSKTVFPHRSVALVHGKLKPKEKEAAMAAFAAGQTDILVSTTVIEVGVDVPNAALMVIENADRFGLSQLHQLRGRVGRGEWQSTCVLVSNNKNPDTRARLKTLCATTDGFRIAQADLEQRGPGDFFGARQHGLPQLHIADLGVDVRLLEQAQAAAQALLVQDPGLQQPELAPLKNRLRHLFTQNALTFN